MDRCTQLDYLRVRVQLAYLEGKVYDDLLSNRSMKLSSETRQGRVAYLFRLLDQWLQKIPGPLRLENITKTMNKAPLTHMILLYHTYLMCYTTLNGLYFLASPWISSINGFTAAILEHFDSRAQACMRHQQPLIPQFWETLSIMGHMERLLSYAGSTSYQKLQVVLAGLGQAADQAVQRAKAQVQSYESTPSVAQPHDSLYSSSSFGGFPDELSHNLVSNDSNPSKY
ncbi:hypothetical protein F5B19DRAFT_467949 [Rostrohypoxylon terebratum]|nr:hypothetical protein F5B19DRAFT_467949 [Rostrohypoxylon terebratum]